MSADEARDARFRIGGADRMLDAGRIPASSKGLELYNEELGLDNDGSANDCVLRSPPLYCGTLPQASLDGHLDSVPPEYSDGNSVPVEPALDRLPVEPALDRF